MVFMDFTSITFPDENINYIAPTWNEMNQLAFNIAKQIRSEGQRFDRIITLAKGGWPMTRSLVDFLGVEKVASIGVKFYSGVNEHMDKPRIYQDLPIPIAGENILLFDDVADTGESLQFVKDYLRSKGINGVRTATLFYKPHSKIKPDYYGAETDTWIVFPYDMIQDGIFVLRKKWREAGLLNDEIMRRFQKFGFKLEWLKEYL